MNRSRWTLLLVCVATFMLLLDISVVTTALPAIRDELDASFSDVQWVLDAYTLALAALLLPAASLADLRGRRSLFLIGMAVFTVASAACAAAQDALMLNISRTVQGAGGALLFATALPLLANEFQGKRRAGAIGVWSATLAGSIAVGPLIGGALTDGLGWRWIFLVNVPVGIFALVAARFRLNESRDPAGRRIDVPGLLLLGVGLTGVVLGTVRGNADGWTSPLVLTGFIAGGVLLTGFIVVEMRSREPMLDLRLFRSARFTGAFAVAVLVSLGVVGIFAYTVITLQSGFGYDALESGIRFLPLSVTSFFLAAITGRALLGRVPTWILVFVSMVLCSVGALLMTRVGTGHDWSSMVPGLIVLGMGFGMNTPVLADVALSAVEPARAGMATGAMNTGRQVGTAVGIAAFGSLFESRVSGRMTELLGPAVPSDAAAQIGSGVAAGGSQQVLAAVPAPARAAVANAIAPALSSGLADLLVVSSVTTAIAAVLAVVLLRGRPVTVLTDRSNLAAAAA